MWSRKKKVEEKKKLVGIVETGSPGARQGSVEAPRVVLVGSSDQPQQVYGSIRKTLLECKLIEASVNPATAAKVSTTVSGATYPEDFGDFQDYLDAFNYIPFVHRAVVVKHSLIWQMGYDLEAKDDAAKKKVDDLLVQLKADTVIRNGSLWALVFGNMYWQKIKEAGVQRLRALNPVKMGVKLDSKDEIFEYVYERKYGRREVFKPEEIVHLKVDDAPFELFGTSTLRNVLPTIKSMLYMEEKLPLIARRRADPLLAIQIGDKDNPVSEETFKKQKAAVLNRQPGEDLFHDGILAIQEVYQSASVGGRQTIEPLLKHFRENEVAGLGVPDVALGFGGTSTMATAEYQERLLEGEIRDYQRCLKRMHESEIFTLAGVSDVKLVWRPLKEADKFELSKKFCGEIEHGVLSPEWASKQLGYPDDARVGTVMNANLVVVGAPAAGKKQLLARSEAEELRIKALKRLAGET
jgi:hypothetical protein